MSSIELPEEFLGAIMDGEYEQVQDMLLKRTFTQHQLKEALNIAILCRKDKIAFVLLTKITNVNEVAPGQDRPLQMATSMSNFQMVVILISRGAHINLKGNTLQPILNAILAQNIMIVAYLLLYGAEMNEGEQHMLKTTFPKHFQILNRLYSRIQFINKIPVKYNSEVEELKSRITLGNLSKSLDMFDTDYTALRKKHSGPRLSTSSIFKMSESPLPELPID
jgi:hypothetical protein